MLIQGRGDAHSSYHDEAAALDKEKDKYSARALFSNPATGLRK